MKRIVPAVALLIATTAQAQVLTTGGTAGSSVNNGANIGAGNHTGASINADNPTAAQIRSKMGVQGTNTARANTNNQGTNNVTTTPAMMGDTGSVAGSTHTAAQVAGAAQLADILPKGSASYVYYPASKIYFAPGTRTYYYSNNGLWYSGNAVPAGVKLGNQTNVRLKGNAVVKTAP